MYGVNQNQAVAAYSSLYFISSKALAPNFEEVEKAYYFGVVIMSLFDACCIL